MRGTRWQGLAILLICLGLSPIVLGSPISQAQEGGACAVQAEQAVAATGETCADLLPGNACTGYGMITTSQIAESQAVLSATVPLQGLSGITALAVSLPGEQRWSVVSLRVPGMGETPLFAVLYGGATLWNEPGQPVPPVCRATSIGTVNIRAEPNTNAAILGQLLVNESALITARLPDSSWWQIVWNSQPAWVYAQLAPTDCNPAAMVVIDPATGELSGGLPAPDFQGARLESGFSPALCPDAPRGGMLVQSEGEGAAWRINGMAMGLNGTALLQAGANDLLAVQVLEGQVVLEVSGVSRVARAGQLLRVPLHAGAIEGVPGPPLEFVSADAARAPLALLPRPVDLPEVSAAPDLPPGADLVCSPLPQTWVSEPSADRTAEVWVAASAGQPIRVRVAFPQGGTRLLAQPPGEAAQVIAEVSPGQGNAASLMGNWAATQTGVYVVSAEAALPGSVEFTLTCDLPAVLEPPPLQSCESLLLHWDEVSGGLVRFNGRQGATISVVAEHPLPSQGAAQTLAVLTEAGEQIGTVAFVAFPDRQVAGPLDVVLPQDGAYLLRWDGDPFNVVNVEALCRMPPTPSASP